MTLLRQQRDGTLDVDHPAIPRRRESDISGKAGTLERCGRALAWAYDQLGVTGRSQTPSALAHELSCEGVQWSDMPMAFWDELVAFRHLRVDNRVRLCTRFIQAVRT